MNNNSDLVSYFKKYDTVIENLCLKVSGIRKELDSKMQERAEDLGKHFKVLYCVKYLSNGVYKCSRYFVHFMDALEEFDNTLSSEKDIVVSPTNRIPVKKLWNVKIR